MALLDWLNPVGGLISSIGGAIGQGMSNRAQAKENEKNRQFALDMWNKENEYNLYTNQVKRLQDAGLNPALAYSDASSTLSAHAQTPNTDNKYGNVFQRGIGDYFTAQQVKIQEKQTDSNIKLNESQEEKNKAEATESSTRALGQQADNVVKLATIETQISTLKTQRDNLVKEGEILDEKKFQELEKSIQELEHSKQELEKTAQEEQKTLQAKNETARSEEAIETQKAMTINFKAQANQADSAAALDDAIRANQPYVRAQLEAQSNELRAMARKLQADYGLSKAEADKCVIEAYNAFKNGQVDRFLKTGPQRFGTGPIGSIIGSFTDQLGINVGANTVGSWIKKKISPIIKPIGKGLYRFGRGNYGKKRHGGASTKW